MSVSDEKNHQSLIHKRLLAAVIDATAVTSCVQFSHVIKVNMMVIVLTNILQPINTVKENYLRVLVVNKLLVDST